MIPQALAIAVVAGAVAVLVAAELSGRRLAAVVAKTAASTAFLVLAVMRSGAATAYDRRVLAALALCVAGDALLLAPRGFAAGLGSFLLAHLAYVAAFCAVLPPRGWPVPALVALLPLSAGVAAWLWPHLGSMKVPVLAYIAAITAMVWGAVAIAPVAGWKIGAAGALFYLSDLAVARDRLVVRRFASRAWGLPAYYLAQVLFALTLGRGLPTQP